MLLIFQLQMFRLRNVSEKFYNKLSDNDEESGDETELFTRSKQKKSEVKFVEKVIEEGDTLQSISIKHRCTVSKFESTHLLINGLLVLYKSKHTTWSTNYIHLVISVSLRAITTGPLSLVFVF